MHRPGLKATPNAIDTHQSLSTVSGQIPHAPTVSGKWVAARGNSLRLSADTFAVVFDTKRYLARPQNGNRIGCDLLSGRIYMSSTIILI